MKLVIVESPFAGNRDRNKRYLESCLRDCIMGGESPYASHKMLTDCLDDDKPEERELGIAAGLAWKKNAKLTVFYIDLGWSSGMQRAYEFCRARNLPYETRLLSADDVFWIEEKVRKRNMNTKIEACARAAHEANRAYCIAVGDNSQASWEDAPDWQKQSAMKGVEGVLAGNTPEQSHEGWLKEKQDTGWKYGPTKDPDKKEHPCFVPYSELPEEQKAKDHVFVGVVRGMARALGLEIVGGR